MTVSPNPQSPVPGALQQPKAGHPGSSSSTAFIGGGNMARSLIGGLRARGVAGDSIRVSEPSDTARQALEADFGVATFADGAQAVDGAGIWVLAVKPQVLRQVCEALAPLARAQRPVLVSIAAGITSAQISRWLGGGEGAEAPAIVRCMPNTPAMLGAGVTGLFATPAVDAAGREQAQALLSSAGETVWIDDEALMDSVTATSGSGPAYVFLLAEAMEDAARRQGLPDDAARKLVLQTILGAARMLTESGEAPAELRRRVTSPGGTTHSAVETFETGGLRELVDRAMGNAAERGRQLSAAND